MLKKLSAVVLGVMMFAVVAVPAQAQTVDINALLQQIAALQAQIQALQGTTATTPATPASLPSTQNLTIGSRGADVVALQTWLESTGDLVMPAGVAKGYFGAITQSALAKWQARYGVAPASGYYGPITRAKIQEVLGSTPSTGTGTTPNCPAGFTCTPSSGSTPTFGTGAQTEGSLDVLLKSTPSNETVKKGQTKDVMGFELDVRDSDVKIERVDVRMDVRPWLYFNKISIMDGNTVVAEKEGLSSSDFTEITSGSEYRIRFSGLNYVVPKDTKKTLTVRVSALSFTDRSTGQISVLADTRAVRGIDTKGIDHEDGWSTARTFTFESSSVGEVRVSVNPNSPTERYQGLSENSKTSGVALLVFDLEARNQDVEVKDLSFTHNVVVGGSRNAASMFNKLTLLDSNGNEIANYDTLSSTVGNTATSTFTDLEIMLKKDQKSTFRLVAELNEVTNTTVAAGDAASTTLKAATFAVVAEDANYEDSTVGGSNAIGENVTFTLASVSVENASANSTPVTDNPDLAQVEFRFTLKASGEDVYVSKTILSALATSSTASSASVDLVDAGNARPGDTGTSFYIPAGTSRTFTYSGSMINTGGTSGVKEFKITSINWGESNGSNAANSITFGLENLRTTRFLTN